MRRLIYIANARIPTEKAHGLQIMKMCEAFARLGFDVELWLPQRKNHILDDPFDFYSVKKNFSLRSFPVWDLVGMIPHLGFWLENTTFSLAVVKALKKEPEDAIVYSRDQISLAMIQKRTGRATYFELHNPPQKVRPFHIQLWQNAKHIFVINQQILNFLNVHGVLAKKITVCPSALDEKFIASLNQVPIAVVRQQLQISTEKKLIVYTGHLYPEKGIDSLIAAMTELPDNYFCLIIGGTADLIHHYQQVISEKQLEEKVRMVGWVKHEIIASYLTAADVLVISNSARWSQSNSFTSPMKVFEYMAARRSIVASDVPALREILNDSSAYFFQPDSAHSLAETIRRVVDSPELKQKIERAYEQVKELTWLERAKKIVSKFL